MTDREETVMTWGVDSKDIKRQRAEEKLTVDPVPQVHGMTFRSSEEGVLSVLRSGPVRSFFLFRKDQDQDRS